MPLIVTMLVGTAVRAAEAAVAADGGASLLAGITLAVSLGDGVGDVVPACAWGDPPHAAIARAAAPAAIPILSFCKGLTSTLFRSPAGKAVAGGTIWMVANTASIVRSLDLARA